MPNVGSPHSVCGALSSLVPHLFARPLAQSQFICSGDEATPCKWERVDDVRFMWGCRGSDFLATSREFDLTYQTLIAMFSDTVWNDFTCNGS